MASPMVLQQVQPQQQQQSNIQANTNDPLFQALAKYVTTGHGASHTTSNRIQEMINTASSHPGGRAHLEVLCNCDPHEGGLWHNDATTTGSIALTKTGAVINLSIPSLQVDYQGKVSGFFMPFQGPLNNGTIYYNDLDNLQPGPASIKMRVVGLTLNIDFYRNQTYVASFNCSPIAFTMSPHPQEGSGSFS